MVFHYFKIALRKMIRQPGYDVMNIIGLAIGITCCMLILVYIQNELGYDRFHEHSDRIYRVVNGNSARTPTAAGPTLEELFPEVEDYARMRGTVNIWMMSYQDNGYYESDVYRVSKDFLNVFTFPLVRGNPRTMLDDFVNPEQTVVISESMATKLFGDEDTMGKLILADDEITMVVTGVMKDVPPNAHFAVDYLVSENLDFGNRREGFRTNWFGTSHYTYILLAEGTDPVELEGKIARWADTYEPLKTLKTRGLPFSPRLQPVTDIHLRSNLELDMAGNSDIDYIYTFSAVAISIVLIACINFMNLAMARSSIRAKEVAIRKTVGATRGELILQYMGESMWSAGLAFVAAIGLFAAILPYFNALMGTEFKISYLEHPEQLLWLIGIMLFTGLLSGSYPALVVSRFHPAKVLKGESTGGVTGSMLRKGLVAAQFTVSILLIISTATVYRQLEYMQNRQLGFDKDQVVIIPLIGGAERGFNTLKERLSQSPHIQEVTRSVLMPGRKASAAVMPVFPTRLAEQSEDDEVGIPALFVTRDFEETLGLSLIAGRPFSSVLADDSLNAVIMTRSAVERLGLITPAEIVGRHIHPGRYRGPPIRIIGVVEDFHMRGLHSAVEPMQLRLLTRGGGGQAAIRLQAQN
ncbi:MAG: FtsX-like permease family protein, partial [Gemmatimonadetes bacterium]|nr:FtsX-like permease family protein [Gemmatimonadota bacterium]